MKAGADDSISDAKDYLKATIPTDEFNEPMIDAYLENGPKMVKFMEDNTDVSYTSLEHYPDYFQDAPGVKLGNRALEPSPVSADTLGDDVDNFIPQVHKQFFLVVMELILKSHMRLLLNHLDGLNYF